MPNRPKLTIDVGPLIENQWTGIPVFTRRLVQALILHGGMDLAYMIQLTRISSDTVMDAIRAGTGVFLRDQFETAKKLEPADRNAAFLYPSVKGSGGVNPKEASTVHDLSTLHLPEFHEEANIRYHLDNLATELGSDEVIFCVSEATRKDVNKMFPSVKEKTRLLTQYVDWPEHFPVLDRNLPALRLGRYAVVVGTIEPRKNLGLLIRALEAQELRDSPVRFVVIGRKGWKVDAFLAGLPPETRNRVLFTGFISEFMKYRLLKGAEFLILTSIYEGFGIPILEALSLGKPVLASRTSSLPEVAGEAAVYFDPLSVSDFASAFATIAHPLKLAELAPSALASSLAFNPQRMAAPIVEWMDI